MKFEIEIDERLIPAGHKPEALAFNPVTGEPTLVTTPPEPPFEWPDWLLASRATAITYAHTASCSDGWRVWCGPAPEWVESDPSLGQGWYSEREPIGVSNCGTPIGHLFDCMPFRKAPGFSERRFISLRPVPTKTTPTTQAEAKSARARLLQPFDGSEAEAVGATSYKLQDGERWETMRLGKWQPGRDPVWVDRVKYRLADKLRQGVDELGREILVGDTLYKRSSKSSWVCDYRNLEPYSTMLMADCIRCPRPGEQVPDFDEWKEMCLAMQNAGAKFLFEGESRTGRCDFTGLRGASAYSRDPNCDWELK